MYYHVRFEVLMVVSVLIAIFGECSDILEELAASIIRADENPALVMEAASSSGS
jgi:hypothetical protein